MSLSQERTKTVLEYCYNLFNGDDDIKFIKEFISANGLSSSKLKYLPSGEEDKEKSWDKGKQRGQINRREKDTTSNKGRKKRLSNN